MEVLNDDNFDEKTDGICVVDFYADWCGPCKMMAPVFEELSKEMKSAKFFKVDTEASPNLSERFEIRSIPCIVIIENGEEISRIVGFMKKEELAAKIDHVLEDKV